jgi:hypothetical protein
MKKSSALLLFLFILIASLNAQTITKSKLLGKWKVTAVDMKDKRISLASEASIMQGLAPNRELSREDSVLFKNLAGMLYSTLGNMSFEFKNNDSVYMAIGFNIEGEVKLEKEVSTYSVNNNKLSMSRGRDQMDDMEITMPDPQTLVFNNFDARAGRSGRTLVLKKQ